MMSVKSNTPVDSPTEEASNFSSSAKDRGGLVSPSFSLLTLFRIALEISGRHTVL